MKKLVYLTMIVFLGMGCSHYGTPSAEETDTTYIAPDSVWDYSGLPNYDSIDQVTRAHSYQWYGDSDALENGIPEERKSKGMPPKDTLWMLKEDTPYYKMPKD